MKTKLHRTLFLLLTLALLCAFGLSAAASSPQITELRIEPASLTLKHHTSDLLNVGWTGPDQPNLIWSSSNTNIVDVTTASGTTSAEIYAKGFGTATITVAAQDGSSLLARCVVTVPDNRVKSVTLKSTELTLASGKTSPILQYAIDAGDPNDELTYPAQTWTSSDTAVAVVDATGRVTGVAPGTAQITLTVDGKTSNACTVTVEMPLTRLTLPSAESVAKGESKTLTVTYMPSNTTFKTVTWSSDNENVATVDQSGKVTGVNPGNCNIIVRSTYDDSIFARCYLTVPRPPETVRLQGMMLRDNKIELIGAGASTELNVIFTPPDASDQTVTWSSSDERVATVSDAGVVVAVAEGTATITVTANADPSVKDSCTVQVKTPSRTVDGILIRSYQSTMVSGGTQTVTAYLWPVDAGIKEVEWSTDTPAGSAPILTFNTNLTTAGADGTTSVVVTAARNRVGTVRVIATTVDGRKIASCDIRVDAPRQVEGITLNEDDISVIVGGTETLEATLIPPDAQSKVLWYTNHDGYVQITPDPSDSRRATVRGLRETSGLADGLIITAQTEAWSFTATCAVNVTTNAVPATDVELRHNDSPVGSLILEPDFPYGLVAVISPANTTERKSLTWSSSDTDIVTVSDGVVTGVSPGIASVTATVGAVSAVVPVEVSGITIAPNDLNPLPIGGNTTVVRTPYGNAKQVTGWDWSSSDTNIARVNAVTGQVTAVAPGTCTIYCKGGAYTGACQVSVRGAGAETVTAKLVNGQVGFTSLLSDLRKSCFEMTYGGTLKYITRLTVATSEGTLFDSYVAEPDTGAGVSSTQNYYAPNSENLMPLITDLYFVPRKGFSGNAMISYIGYTANNEAYTGYVLVPVPNPGNADSVSISYTSREGEPIRFQIQDFSDYAQLITGRDIRHVSFILPSEQRGTLQFNLLGDNLYERPVSATAEYNAIGNPSLGDVWFVPKTDFNGSFKLAFRGVDMAMNALEGNILITVGTVTGTNSNDISYTVASGSRLFFEPADFNDICKRVTGSELNYIFFERLSDSRGALYETSNTNAKADTRTQYYRTAYGGRRTIAELNFQSTRGTNGTALFYYTGVSNKDEVFSGVVRITVTSDSYGAIEYQVFNGQRVTFRASDFDRTCRNATGAELDYVRFTEPPSASRGILSCNGAPVTNAQSYYFLGREAILDAVVFTAANVYTGTFDIPFTGWSIQGRSYTGVVKITVDGAKVAQTPATTTTGGSVTYYSDGGPVRLQGNDFAAASASKLTYALADVRFTQPEASVGRLCLDYYSPTSYTMASGTERYTQEQIYRVTFLPKGGFSGTANVKFIASDVTGKSYTGTMMVQVTPRTDSYRFRDMSPYPWAAPAVDFLAENGIVNGTADGEFSPTALTRRCDFVLMLSRAFSFPYAGYDSFSDVPSDSYYSGAVAGAKSLGITTGDQAGRFNPEGRITRQDAAVFLYRTMRSQGSMPVGTAYDLAGFSDRDRISDYAVEAVASLVRIGVFTGDDHRRLNPASFLTRAEMATVFYRAIT